MILMIGKNVIGSRPATLAEVSGILEKRLEEAEAEFKKMKKEKKVVVVEKPPEPPAEGAEAGAEGAPAPVPAPPEEKSPLGLEQRYALEYSKKFAKVGKRKAEEVFEKLMKVDKMKPEAAVKLIDIMPKNKEQAKLILTKERMAAGDKEAEEVLKIVDEFRK